MDFLKYFFSKEESEPSEESDDEEGLYEIRISKIPDDRLTLEGLFLGRDAYFDSVTKLLIACKDLDYPLMKENALEKTRWPEDFNKALFAERLTSNFWKVVNSCRGCNVPQAYYKFLEYPEESKKYLFNYSDNFKEKTFFKHCYTYFVVKELLRIYKFSYGNFDWVLFSPCFAKDNEKYNLLTFLKDNKHIFLYERYLIYEYEFHYVSLFDLFSSFRKELENFLSLHGIQNGKYLYEKFENDGAKRLDKDHALYKYSIK